MSKKVRDTILLIAVIVVAAIICVTSVVKEKKQEVEMIVGIHIKGEVNSPGYYELDYGSRVKDAIDCAGGKTEKADIDSINLAEKLVDGQEIIISKKNEGILEESGKINLNKADMYTLCQLDGIGEATANDIIEYRTKNGGFKTIDDLKKIKGIGQAKFDQIKDSIIV